MIISHGIFKLNRLNLRHLGASVLAMAMLWSADMFCSPAFAQDAMTKAIGLFQKKDYQAASQAFRAMADSKQGATAHNYLGLCYLQLGHQSYAQAIFERLVQIWPDSPEAKLASKCLGGPTGATAKKQPEQGALSEREKANNAMAKQIVAELSAQGGGLTRAQWEKLPQKTRIPIERQGGHLWLRVKVNGQDCRMAFDTGASICTVSVVDYPNVVPRSELLKAPVLPVSRVYGVVATRLLQTEISVQDITRKLDTCFINEQGCNVIGQNFFKEYSYQVDDFYVRLTKAPFPGDAPAIASVNSLSGARVTRKQNDKFSLPFEVDGGTLLVDITVNGHPAKARFDTGCGADGLVIHPSMNRALGITRVNPRFGVADRLEVGHITKMGVQVVYENGLDYPLIGPKVFDRGYTVDQQAKLIHFDY